VQAAFAREEKGKKFSILEQAKIKTLICSKLAGEGKVAGFGAVRRNRVRQMFDNSSAKE